MRSKLSEVASNAPSGDFFPEVRWQRCTEARGRTPAPMVHYYRNVFSHVPNGKMKEAANMLKAIHAQESLEEAPRWSLLPNCSNLLPHCLVIRCHDEIGDRTEPQLWRAFG